jgi:hypothetical protein
MIRNVEVDIKDGTYTESVWEQEVEDNIFTKKE